MAVNPINLKVPAIPQALHRGGEELPWARFCEGVEFQLLHVDVEGGLWVVRTIFQHGVTIQQHKHTGEVYAVTFSGAWKYLEYPDTVNTAFSYLYEPAGSVHTLTTDIIDLNGPTDIWFAIRGANLNLDSDGNVESIVDAGSILELYRDECEKAGYPVPNTIGAG